MELKQGDLENIILNALWDLEAENVTPIFVSAVQERIRSRNKRWAYTTVKTVLDRLVDKDIAIREKLGKKFFYQTVVKREDAGVLAIQKVMRQFFRNDVDEMVACMRRIKAEPGSDRVAVGQALSLQPQLVTSTL